MVILVLNCGSSSIKYQVIDMEAQSSKLLAKGLVERIGLPEGDLTHKPVGKEKFELHQPIPDHTTGISLVLQALTDPVHGVIRSLDEVKAVGHRVAHTLKAIRDTASSRATTCRMVSTKGPLALYCRMVIMVEAG